MGLRLEEPHAHITLELHNGHTGIVCDSEPNFN